MIIVDIRLSVVLVRITKYRWRHTRFRQCGFAGIVTVLCRYARQIDVISILEVMILPGLQWRHNEM